MSFETKTPIQRNIENYSHWAPSDVLTGATDQPLQRNRDLIDTHRAEQEITQHIPKVKFNFRVGILHNFENAVGYKEKKKVIYPRIDLYAVFTPLHFLHNYLVLLSDVPHVLFLP